MDGLRRLLNEWDFLGVRFAGIHDEYDCLLGPLIRVLDESADSGRIVATLRQEIEGHFGLDPDALDVDDFADRLATWWSNLPVSRGR